MKKKLEQQRNARLYVLSHCCDSAARPIFRQVWEELRRQGKLRNNGH